MGGPDTAQRELPDYERPPITEVVYGVGFAGLSSLLAPHLGLLWDKYRAEYPHCEEKPPLFQKGDQLQLTDVPPLPRVWFVNPSGHQLIQIQRDRFLHNWRELAPEDDYPRYRVLKERYRDLLGTFVGFVSDNGLGEVSFRNAEMTYINHITIGEDSRLKSIEDVGTVFPDFGWRPSTSRGLGELQGVNWQTVLALPEDNGTLSTVIRSARRIRDNQPVFVLELAARSNVGEFTQNELWSWFDAAHHQIVWTFSQLADERFQHDVWGRK